MSPTITTGLTAREREAFERARNRGYLVDSPRRRPHLANAWWRYCERADRPYVRVVRRAGSPTASLTVDLGPQRRIFPESAVGKFDALYHEHATVASVYFPGRRRVAFCSLPVQTIEALVPTILRRTFEAEIEEARRRR